MSSQNSQGSRHAWSDLTLLLPGNTCYGYRYSQLYWKPLFCQVSNPQEFRHQCMNFQLMRTSSPQRFEPEGKKLIISDNSGLFKHNKRLSKCVMLVWNNKKDVCRFSALCNRRPTTTQESAGLLFTRPATASTTIYVTWRVDTFIKKGKAALEISEKPGKGEVHSATKSR